ncbi:hypothetical protein DPMN_107834 [Dreissena polymorpha]|uniref:Uncharacterized protein n=1 Tax=Dreissena polymorpha TaxID=45954 RepID=A0A9D4K7X6_DREPO|nr:hypothetical protein DPMN_107834 [Dreissena polymorpha]
MSMGNWGRLALTELGSTQHQVLKNSLTVNKVMWVDHGIGQPEVHVKVLQVVGLLDHYLQVDHNSSKDSRESKSHRKGTTGSASKITAGGRFSRSPSFSRLKSLEDRRGSSHNRKRTIGSARKVLQVIGLLDHHLSVGQSHQNTEENLYATGNGQPEVGKEQLQVVGSFISPSFSGSPEDKRRS